MSPMMMLLVMMVAVWKSTEWILSEETSQRCRTSWRTRWRWYFSRWSKTIATSHRHSFGTGAMSCCAHTSSQLVTSVSYYVPELSLTNTSQSCYSLMRLKICRLKCRDDIFLGFFRIMDEMTSRAIRAQSSCVVSATKFGLVLGMSLKVSQLLKPMSKLALVTILASSILFKWSTQLCLVTTWVLNNLSSLLWILRRLTQTSVKLLVLRQRLLRFYTQRMPQHRVCNSKLVFCLMHLVLEQRTRSWRSVVMVVVHLLMSCICRWKRSESRSSLDHCPSWRLPDIGRRKSVVVSHLLLLDLLSSGWHKSVQETMRSYVSL